MSLDPERRRTLRCLSNLIESEPKTPAELDEELRLYGEDPKAVEREARALIGRLRRNAALHGAHERFDVHRARVPRLREEARRRMDRTPNARQRLLDMFREGEMGDVQFRNLEALPEADLLDMLDEANLLDFLNELGEEP